MDAIYRITSDGIKELVASTESQTKTMTYHKLELKTNYEGKMEFYLPKNNPILHELNPLWDEITFERNGEELFRGCITGSVTDILNTGRITCMGALAYLKNAYVEPYEFTGGVYAYVLMLLTAYNDNMEPHKQIQIGSVTVTDPNDYIVRSDTTRKTVYELLSDKLVGKLGGYLRIRVVDNVKYLDYLAAYNSTAAQKVKTGYNIIDFTDEKTYQDIYTVLVPLGAENSETGARLTVKDVNDGSIYVINQNALSVYGWRETVVEWDDVTVAENLLSKAQELSDSYASPVRSMEINAVDLSKITDVNCFHIGDKIITGSDYHDIAAEIILSEQDIYALQPESEVLVLGTTKQSYFSYASSKLNSINDDVTALKKDNFGLDEKIANAKGLYTTIEQSEDGTTITWLHDNKELNLSNLRINISTAGIHVSPDGGATYYGMDMDGNVIANLLSATGISADYIYGGTLSSIATDDSGQPVTFIDMDSGEIARLGNIAWVKRTTGNESLKWVGPSESEDE